MMNRIKSRSFPLFGVAMLLAGATTAHAAPAKYERCLKQYRCDVVITGMIVNEPKMLLVVLTSEAKTWTKADWDAALEGTKKLAREAKANPAEAIVRYTGIRAHAPIFPSLIEGHELEKHLKTVTLGVSSRRLYGKHKGVPNFGDMDPKPGYANVPL